ncbi:MAG: hypothetical protein WC227_02220 [Patescibacteria group bacterium]|jgi:hypothetical protein
MEKEQKYQDLLKEAKADSSIVGFILAAGRGKGVFTEKSDYDVFIIIRDEVADEYIHKFDQIKDPNTLDINAMSLSSFEKYAELGTPSEWDRYNFSHLKAEVDKLDGGIKKLIDRKGSLSDTEIRGIVSANLDGYINSYYRSIKNDRDGDTLSSRLDASESVPLLLTALFALHGRIKPYNKFLKSELENFPLEKLPWDSGEFMALVLQIISTGNVEVQKQVFQKISELFRSNGYDGVITGWDGYWLG